MKRKICFITGTRAEYGLLHLLMKEVQKDPEFELQIIATGMHLSEEYGMTYKEIEKDGLPITRKIEILLSSDTSVGTGKAIGLGVIGFSEAFAELEPDLVVVLGDRFELLAAAQVALISRIPIAHIFGGDTTEGAFDEGIRHSITKMSHIHFSATESSKKRILQMGENPNFVFNFGSPGVDNIHKLELFDKNRLEQDLKIQFGKKNILFTYHSVTLESQDQLDELDQVFGALDQLDDTTKIIITMPNADPKGKSIADKIRYFSEKKKNVNVFTSLGQIRYLSLLSVSDCVVGNSSSGILEAPALKVPTVNIGDRQKGRERASSVIDCRPKLNEVYESIQRAFAMDCSKVECPFGDGNSVEKILNKLKEIKDYRSLLKKKFYSV